MGVSHAEIDLQIAAERDANARDTPCLFCAPVDCRVGGLMEIILGAQKIAISSVRLLTAREV